MNPGNWNLNPMANYAGLPYEQTNAVERWNVAPYDDQFNNFHALIEKLKRRSLVEDLKTLSFRLPVCNL